WSVAVFCAAVFIRAVISVVAWVVMTRGGGLYGRPPVGPAETSGSGGQHRATEDRAPVADGVAAENRAPARGAPTILRPHPLTVGQGGLPMAAQGILFAFLVVYLGLQAWTYGLAD